VPPPPPIRNQFAWLALARPSLGADTRLGQSIWSESACARDRRRPSPPELEHLAGACGPRPPMDEHQTRRSPAGALLSARAPLPPPRQWRPHDPRPPPPANPSPAFLPILFLASRAPPVASSSLAELPKPPSPQWTPPHLLHHDSNTLPASPKHIAPSGFPPPLRLLRIPTPPHGHRHRSSSLLHRLLDLTTGSCPKAGGDGDSDAVRGVGLASVGATEPSRGSSWSFSTLLPPAP
jgi:hypothetical protein